MILSYPALISNKNWNIIAKKIEFVKLDERSKIFYIQCELSDVNDVRSALNSYKKYIKKLEVKSKDTKSQILCKTYIRTEARNISVDLLNIIQAGPIVEIDPTKGSGKTQGGGTVNTDGTLTQTDINNQKTKETISTIFSTRNIIIGMVVIAVGIVGFMIYKKRK